MSDIKAELRVFSDAAEAIEKTHKNITDIKHVLLITRKSGNYTAITVPNTILDDKHKLNIQTTVAAIIGSIKDMQSIAIYNQTAIIDWQSEQVKKLSKYMTPVRVRQWVLDTYGCYSKYPHCKTQNTIAAKIGDTTCVGKQNQGEKTIHQFAINNTGISEIDKISELSQQIRNALLIETQGTGENTGTPNEMASALTKLNIKRPDATYWTQYNSATKKMETAYNRNLQIDITQAFEDAINGTNKTQRH